MVICVIEEHRLGCTYFQESLWQTCELTELTIGKKQTLESEYIVHRYSVCKSPKSYIHVLAITSPHK